MIAKSVAGLAGGLCIGGLLYLVLAYVPTTSKTSTLASQGFRFLLIGLPIYGIAYFACHILYRIGPESK